MCSGWTTWGNRTTLGSGNRRTVPSKPVNSGFMVVPQVVVRVGPGGRRRVEADHRQQVGVGGQARRRLVVGQQLGEADSHLPAEVVHVQPPVRAGERLEVLPAGAVQLAGTAEVAVDKV